jgi:hypothetical protein
VLVEIRIGQLLNTSLALHRHTILVGWWTLTRLGKLKSLLVYEQYDVHFIRFLLRVTLLHDLKELIRTCVSSGSLDDISWDQPRNSTIGPLPFFLKLGTIYTCTSTYILRPRRWKQQVFPKRGHHWPYPHGEQNKHKHRTCIMRAVKCMDLIHLTFLKPTLLKGTSHEELTMRWIKVTWVHKIHICRVQHLHRTRVFRDSHQCTN